MENDDTIKELTEKFNKTQQELGFKATFEELEDLFFIKDSILKDGFVSEKFSRQLTHRMLDTYASWITSLHNLIMPNPQDLISLTECKKLTSEEKTKASDLIGLAMNLIRKNSIIGLTKDKIAEGKLIDEIFQTWKNKFEPGILELEKKIQTAWEENNLK